MKILSLETSFDETSAAVLEKNGSQIKVLSLSTASSARLHVETGGVIPEKAAREQVKSIIPVITEALVTSQSNNRTSEQSPNKVSKQTKYNTAILEEGNKARQILQNQIDAIAVTNGPGLIGSLLVGVESAKTLSFVYKKPLIPTHHLLAHIFANFIEHPDISFPFIGLIVSGAHTDLLYFKSYNEYTWLGGTRDDAAGEAFDKTGRLLGLPYPSGPEIEKRASQITKPLVKFASPLIHSDDYDFSFSGLKTEVLRFVQKHEPLDDEMKNHISYAIQSAISESLISKTLRAAKTYHVKTILLGGGVAANQTLKKKFIQKASDFADDIKIYSPSLIYCTDNAAMIGSYALLHPESKPFSLVKAEPELYFS